jgi:hypothetical protein
MVASRMVSSCMVSTWYHFPTRAAVMVSESLGLGDGNSREGLFACARLNTQMPKRSVLIGVRYCQILLRTSAQQISNMAWDVTL